MTIRSQARRFRTDSLEVPLQDPTIMHHLFQLITEMSEDEKRVLLRLLKRGTLKSKCRRQHFRKPVHIPVRYTKQDGLCSGVIRDISLGGVFILSRKALPLGQSLSVSFSPTNFDKTIWIAGDVMRVTPEGIGVRFRSMSEAQKTAVISIASRQ
jgi:c-di-GMP-binding flagellar brake protein YcgR